MELDDFAEALDALVAAGAGNYGDGASIEELHRHLSRFESFVTEATAAFEVGEEWAADGAKTAPAWIATRCRVPRAAARRRVRLGRALRHLPECAEAWREGVIGTDQARAIASARRHRTESSMARDEGMLVAQAAQMGFEDFYRALSYWKQLADPDGADAADEDRKASRNVFLEASFSGMWLGQMTLDPVSGTIVSNELNRLEHELFEADCAEARNAWGARRASTSWPAPRPSAAPTPSSRWRRGARSAPADGIRPAPLFSVFVGYETIHGRICELENGTVMTPSALSPWMDSAYFERAIFSLGTRIDVSVRARLFTGGTRRALELRDRMCTHPYCYEPAESCQADHIQPWAEGGPTTQENGRLLCGFHNRLRNQRQRQRPPPAAA